MGSDKGSPCTENAIEAPVGGPPDDLTSARRLRVISARKAIRWNHPPRQAVAPSREPAEHNGPMNQPAAVSRRDSTRGVTLFK